MPKDPQPASERTLDGLCFYSLERVVVGRAHAEEPAEAIAVYFSDGEGSRELIWMFGTDPIQTEIARRVVRLSNRRTLRPSIVKEFVRAVAVPAGDLPLPAGPKPRK
jgi:hypothetical protein